MPVNLNFLPPELAVSKNLVKILKTLRAVGVIAVAAFLVSSLGLGIFLVVGNINLGNLNKSNNQLKAQIGAQETSEQQIAILKDRIAKIEQAQSSPNVSRMITDVSSLLANLSPDSTISLFSFTPPKTDISMNIKSNSDLTTFLKSFSNPQLFSSVYLSSFNYDLTRGYSVTLSLLEK